MNCIIVDDEYPSIKELGYFIKNFSSISISGEFDDSIKALEHVKNNRTDVIFLDINMPKLDGVSLGQIIRNFENTPLIVFITAYRDHAVDAFEIGAFDYILKPYSESRIVTLLKKLEMLGAQQRSNTGKIALWKGDKMVVVNTEDIIYCEAQEREVCVCVRGGKFVINSSITDFQNRLPQGPFFRCHRSFIVNLDKIDEIIPWFNNTFVLKFKGVESEIPVSRNKMSDFKILMGI